MKSFVLPTLIALAISSSTGPAFCHGGGGFHGGGLSSGGFSGGGLSGGFSGSSFAGSRYGGFRSGSNWSGSSFGGRGFHHDRFVGNPYWGLGAYGYGYGYGYGYANDYGGYTTDDLTSQRAEQEEAEGKRFDEENRKQIKRLQSLPHTAFVKTYNWPATTKMAGNTATSSRSVRSGQIAAKRAPARQPL